MQHLTVSERLALAVLPPLLILAMLFGLLLDERRQDYAHATSIAGFTEATRTISGLVHELQRERGASVGVVAS